MSEIYSSVDVLLCERPVQLRLPFRFGNPFVTEASEARLRVTLESRHGQTNGPSAQLKVPHWFDKNSHFTNVDAIKDLRSCLCHAARAAIGINIIVAELWWYLRTAARDALPKRVPVLARGFGLATPEMALMDAACHAVGLSFPDAARPDNYKTSQNVPHLRNVDEHVQFRLLNSSSFVSPLAPNLSNSKTINFQWRRPKCARNELALLCTGSQGAWG